MSSSGTRQMLLRLPLSMTTVADLQPDLAQIGAGLLAPPCARRRLREHLDEIDAPQRPVVVGTCVPAAGVGMPEEPRSAGDFARSVSGASAGLENLSESVPSSP